MSNATVWMSVVVLSACSSDDSTKHWTALVESKEDEGMSIARYVDLDLAEDHEATFGSRGVMETEGTGLVEIMSVPATWESDGGAIAVHIDETATPIGVTTREMDLSCEPGAMASLVCTLERESQSISYTFEEREEEPVPDERWTLVEWNYGYGSDTYPIESTYEYKNGTWNEVLSMALARNGSDVTMSVTDTRSGGGALYSSEQRTYGTWTGDAQPQLQFDTQKMSYACDSDGDWMTCEGSYGELLVWQRE